jgi:hypothetical protein
MLFASRLSKPFLTNASAFGSKSFHCFFEPGCPSSLDNVKQQLFPKIASNMSLSEVEAITMGFALHDRMQFVSCPVTCPMNTAYMLNMTLIFLLGSSWRITVNVSLCK